MISAWRDSSGPIHPNVTERARFVQLELLYSPINAVNNYILNSCTNPVGSKIFFEARYKWRGLRHLDSNASSRKGDSDVGEKVRLESAKRCPSPLLAIC